MSTSFTDRLDFPSCFAFGERTPITLGRSDALVWRLDGKETLFLKAEAIHSLGELPGEAQRLQWLATTPIPAPEVRESFAEDGFCWLLMTALPALI